MELFFSKVAGSSVTKEDFIGRDDNSIAQYTTDLKIVYFHLSEDYLTSVFPNFVAYYSPLYQSYRELSSLEQSNSLLQPGI